MKSPSIYERAMLAAILKEALANQDPSAMATSFAVQKTYMEIKQTAHSLKADREVLKTTITHDNIESASIKSLCETLHAVAMEEMDKQRMCAEMRKYLQTQDFCMCELVPAGPPAMRALQPASFVEDFEDPNDGVGLARRFFEHCSMDWNTNGNQYAPSCAIVQSSGSGKSRLMVEVAKTAPTLYVCCRVVGDSGYPPRTPLIVEYLLFGGTMVSKEQAFCRCAAFFSVATLYARVMWREVARIGRQDSAAVAGVLGGFLDNQLRVDFWSAFIHRMVPIEAAIYAVVNELDTGSSAASRWQAVEDKAQQVTSRYLHTDIYNREGLSLVACFDEAGNLGPRREQGSIDLLTQLHRASRLMSEKLGGVLVMTDTLCGVPSFGQKKNFPSDRMRQFGTESKIFTSLLTHDVRSHTVSRIEQAVSLYSLAHFGRPLWLARMKEFGSFEGDWILDFAAAKITGQVNFCEVAASGDNEELGVALFAARTHIQIVSHTKLTPDLVGSYMARLDGVDVVGNSHCGYPPDSILALGAAKILSSQVLYLEHLQRLSLFVQSEHVQKGFRGELLAQILALRAHDELAFEAGTYFARPVVVRDFLRKLFGEQNHKKFEKLSLVNKHNKGILEGFLNLAQFVKVEGFLPTRADLQHFLSRGAGVVCQNNQEGFDLIIPVLLRQGVKEGEPQQTKTTGPSYAKAISLRKRALQRRMPTARHVLAEVNDLEIHVRSLGPSEKTFVNTKTVEVESDFSNDTASSSENDQFRVRNSGPQDKNNLKLGTENCQSIIDSDHMSYILIQCKNSMSSDSRINPELTPIYPPEQGEEAVEAAIKKIKKTETRPNTGKRSHKRTTTRPYMVLGMFFTQFEDTDLYNIRYKDLLVPPNCLEFVLLNGQYVMREEGSLGDEIASQMTTLLREFSDPANIEKSTSMWNRMEYAPKYGTALDKDKVREVQAAVGRNPGNRREPDSVAARTDPRTRAAKVAPNNASHFVEMIAMGSPSPSPGASPGAVPTPIRAPISRATSRPRRKRVAP